MAITHTWRGDGRRRVLLSPLKGYEEYEAIQFFCIQNPQIPPRIKNGHGSLKNHCIAL